MGARHTSDFGQEVFSEPALLPLSHLGCDAFECALLPLIRKLTHSCIVPDQGSWLPVYGMAEKLWGARTGLPLVYGLSQIVVSLIRLKGEELQILYAFDEETQGVTRDEQLLLLMIHHLRRQHDQAACDFLLDLLDGDMDGTLLEEAQAFASRHSCGDPLIYTHDGVQGSHLRVID